MREDPRERDDDDDDGAMCGEGRRRRERPEIRGQTELFVFLWAEQFPWNLSRWHSTAVAPACGIVTMLWRVRSRAR